MCRCEFRVYVTAKRKCKYNRGNHYKKKPPQDDGAGASVAIKMACRAAAAVVYCCWPLTYCAFALVERSGANLGGVGFGFGSGGISW